MVVFCHNQFIHEHCPVVGKLEIPINTDIETLSDFVDVEPSYLRPFKPTLNDIFFRVNTHDAKFIGIGIVVIVDTVLGLVGPPS